MRTLQEVVLKMSRKWQLLIAKCRSTHAYAWLFDKQKLFELHVETSLIAVLIRFKNTATKLFEYSLMPWYHVRLWDSRLTDYNLLSSRLHSFNPSEKAEKQHVALLLFKFTTSNVFVVFQASQQTNCFASRIFQFFPKEKYQILILNYVFSQLSSQSVFCFIPTSSLKVNRQSLIY